MPDSAPRPRVALFVTCLVDLHRPTVGFAAIRLLERAGCQVEVPRAQTCCGQPAYNAGDRATARDIASGLLDAFGALGRVAALDLWPWAQVNEMFAREIPLRPAPLAAPTIFHAMFSQVSS